MQLTGFGRVALLAGVCSLAAVPVLAAQDTETINKTVPFPANGTVALRTFSGTVHITGTSGHEVVIKAVRRAERDRLDHIKLDIETSGSTVTIDANKRDSSWSERDHDDVVETEFTIEVPEAANLTVHGFSSALDIEKVRGTEDLHTFSGAITVAGAKAAIKAQTFSGAIDVEAQEAGATPSLQAQTFSGAIHAHLADSTKADVTFTSFSGRFDSNLPVSTFSSQRSKMKGTIGNSPSSGATLSFHTFSGDVTLSK